MRTLLLAALVLATALSGCASDGGNGDSDQTATSTATGTSSGTATGTQSGTSSGSSSATGTGNPAGNRAPTVDLTAMTVGLVVNFTLQASDADGDALTYTFRADNLTPATEQTGSGPFPVVLNHTYAAAGTYNATVTVSDGKAEATRTLAVNITVAPPGTKQPVTFQGHADLPDPYNSLLVYPDGCAVGPISSAPSGTFGQTFAIGAEFIGWAWSITDGATTMWWSEADIIGSGPTGTVPDAVDHVDTCIRPPGRDLDYVLTLTPP